jgi:two-component system cell cycle sensor histidine kinase/response regulator CckA
MTARRTLLVVDDDATIRRVLQLSLERAGFRVLAAEHGAAALAVLDAQESPVDLVLTDVVMPEMDGVSLAERVLARPGAPRLMFMSGYIHDPEKLDRVLGRPAPFIQKPFDVDELAERIRADLEKG